MSGTELRTSTVAVGPAVVCTFAGDIHLDTEDEVRRVLAEAIGRLPRVLAIDLSGVRLFASSGLNELAAAGAAAGDRGVPVVLVAPSGAVRRIMELTGTAGLFPVYETLKEALRHPGNRPDTG
ncbi:anti-anti-sigma factor [Streptomyces sp. TLI_235]|nr:STAS domain-containing protein [Streptomyces sp. TLI_235]PBC75568.1 anti-anti-sigma factor [Streptomyces sp. TLI_235]